ncbi:MAG: transcriptional regulator [Rhodobacteraceae bacterium]|nr:transcriptional regulator [Paracoccaceae bacterium]
MRLAETRGISQATYTRYERQLDLLLSTLKDCVRRMGGELKLQVEFPDNVPVMLEGLEELGVPAPPGDDFRAAARNQDRETAHP